MKKISRVTAILTVLLLFTTFVLSGCSSNVNSNEENAQVPSEKQRDSKMRQQQKAHWQRIPLLRNYRFQWPSGVQGPLAMMTGITI